MEGVQDKGSNQVSSKHFPSIYFIIKKREIVKKIIWKIMFILKFNSRNKFVDYYSVGDRCL